MNRGQRAEPDHESVPRDSVDVLLASWRERRPDLDFSPVGIVSRLARLRAHLDRGLDRGFAAHGLSAPSFAVLVTLARIEPAGPVTQRRLMDELGLTAGTISVRIDRLVEEGLVERAPDPHSGRSTLISLTAQGREVFERVVPAHLDNERRLLAALTDDEQAMLAALLRKLLVEFEGSRPPVDAPPRLGLTLAPAHLALTMRESVGLPPVPALLVRAVEEDSPAASAGLRTGDLLVSAGPRELRSIAALYAAIGDAAEDGPLEIHVMRGARRHMVTMRLGLDGRGVPDGSHARTAGRSARGEHVV